MAKSKKAEEPVVPIEDDPTVDPQEPETPAEAEKPEKAPVAESADKDAPAPAKRLSAFEKALRDSPSFSDLDDYRKYWQKVISKAVKSGVSPEILAQMRAEA